MKEGVVINWNNALRRDKENNKLYICPNCGVLIKLINDLGDENECCPYCHIPIIWHG